LFVLKPSIEEATMTENKLPNDTTPLLEKSELVSQISHGPTLNEVASHQLRQSLKMLYPKLDIDPDTTLVATPQWRVVDHQVEAGPTTLESLTHALVHQGLYGTRANYIEGEHFLTLEPEARNPVHLAVSIEEVAGMLNDLAPLLFVELQARQLDFWNSKGHKIARWEELSNSLRKALNVRKVKGWDADECAMAREVFIDPDKATRKNVNNDFSAIQACLIDVDALENEVASHLLIGGALVLKATYRQRELLVLYTIEGGYESFSSMAQLGDLLPARLGAQLAGRTPKWRLYEPDGNIFDHMAWALVSSQLDAIDTLRFLDPTAIEETESGLDKTEHARYQQLETAIPDWLREASVDDIQDYGRYITALGKLYRRPESKAAKGEIPAITDYAQRRMCEAIIKDSRAVGAANLSLNELRIKVTNSFTVDNLILPNPLDQRTETLAEFALENEAPYRATVFFKQGEQVPDWLTSEFLTDMSTQVNIGKAYPELIKRKLIDDPVESRRQKDFYRDQLQLLLPLLALEGKVKKEAGIDEQGYRYICELFNPDTDTVQSIAIYPLSMTPQHRLISVSDSVTNMFIISPREAENDPCLLYRPLLDQPLLQFPSRQNLLYALHQPGELRDSVLAWLPDKTLSFEYAQYVFPVGLPSPWLIAEQVINPLQRLDSFGRVVFENIEITGDILSTLFNSNAKALVDLADRQAQSNAERRWSLLKDSSWALFEVITNMFSGAIGTAIWVWQSINAIQQALDARERGDRFVEWTSIGDVLLTIGIILTHHAVMRRRTLSDKPRIEKLSIEKEIQPEPAHATVTFNPVPLSGELPMDHCTSLEVSGSVPRRSPSALSSYLDTLKVTPPDLADADLAIVNEAVPYLYQLNDRNYAQVGERWFNVLVDGDDQVTIVALDEPYRDGPLLARTGTGQWVLDLRLRLRGGSPKGRLKALKAAKERRKHELETALQSFRTQEALDKIEMEKVQAEVLEAKGADFDRISELYSQKLEAMIDTYQQALTQLQEWRNLGGTTGYTYDLLRLSTELERHLSLWFVTKKNRYIEATQKLAQAADQALVSQQTYVDTIQLATDLSHEMVNKLSISHTVLEGMKAAGRPGITEALHIRKLLPSFTALELKANEIGMAQELCLQEQASPAMPEARNAIGDIVVSAGRAAHQVAQLVKGTDASIDLKVRIEELHSFVEVFADAEQRLQELPDTYPDLLKRNQIDHLRSLIEEFAQLAHSQIQSLLPEQALEPQQNPSRRNRPAPSRQTVKVSKSRPRKPGDDEAAKATEDPLKPFIPVIPKQPLQPLKDMEIIASALDVNLESNQFIERTRKDAFRPRRIPADMQDLFDQQALKLEQTAASVEQAMTRIKAATGTTPPVATLSRELIDDANRMRKAGVSVRANLYKQRKPTQSSFKWMQENKQIDVSRNEQGRIRTKQLGDYFQEYRIFDKANTHQPIWVAHFHYPTVNSPADNPSTAHLKVSDDYLKTLTPDQQVALSTFEPIDGVLRKIDDPVLRKLFLDLEPVQER
jgi:hypothetical protein